VISAKYRTLYTVVAAAVLWLLAAGQPASAAPQDSAQIVIKEFMFAPNSLTIKAGSTVTWTNKDDEPHSVVSDTGLFRSGAKDTDETFSFRFDKPGTYHFTCSIHPKMVGTIIVE
jgi:plastocyanin